MIKIIGVVEFIDYFPIRHDSYILNSKNARLESFDIKKRYDDNGDMTCKVTCKFEVLLKEDYRCKHLNDYISKILPFLNTLLSSHFSSVRILNTKHYDIRKIHESIKHITELF